MNLFCDNNPTIDISHNPVQHDRTKHIEVYRHFIKQNHGDKVIQLPFVKFKDQLTNILTKAVPIRSFYSSFGKLRMWDIYAPIERKC